MTYDEIRNLPTAMHSNVEHNGNYTNMKSNPVFESDMRAFRILEKVTQLLKLGTPPAVVLELIFFMEGGNNQQNDARISHLRKASSNPADFVNSNVEDLFENHKA